MKTDCNVQTEAPLVSSRGFTVVEVIIASAIMTILAIGTLSVYGYVIRINQGNNLRSQALTVLQAEAEYYRSLKFVPGAGLTSVDLHAGTKTPKTMLSKDGIAFTVTATVDNDPLTDGIQTANEGLCTFKEIKIMAAPINPNPGWLSNLKTDLTIQRVRSN